MVASSRGRTGDSQSSNRSSNLRAITKRFGEELRIMRDTGRAFSPHPIPSVGRVIDPNYGLVVQRSECSVVSREVAGSNPARVAICRSSPMAGGDSLRNYSVSVRI